MAENFNFNPYIWESTIQAYLRRKNVFYNLAFKDETLESAPGTTAMFPYWTLMSGTAQKPAADQQLTINTINNNNFNVTVAELGDAVALTDSQKYNLVTRSSARSMGGFDPEVDPFDDWSEESMRQIAFRFVSTIDADIVTLLQQPSSYVQGFLGAASTDLFSYSTLTAAKFTAFGDRANEAKVCVCHSFQFVDFISSVGGLSAFDMRAIRQDILDDGFFQGRFNGVDFYISDNVPLWPSLIGGKKGYMAFLFKENPFGVTTKQKPQAEHKRDILGRREIISATHWYGVLNLHAVISSQDLRTAAIITPTVYGG